MSRQIRPPVRFPHRVARLAEDCDGGILAMSVVLLVFVLGTGGLILDFGRVWNSQSELQAFADHAALTAAGELNGAADAIQRANAALGQLIADRQSYAAEGFDLDSDDLTATFLDGLPADDQDDDFGPFITTDATAARFVHVEIDPHTVSTMFAGIIMRFAGTDQVDITTSAVAVAGYTQYVCDITPLMICNPDEPAGNTNQLFPYTPTMGQQIRLKMQGAGSSFRPGDFGLLDAAIDPDGPCPVNQGAASLRCAMAAVESITQCVAKTGVDVRPGELAQAFASGVNVRFDMFTGSFNGKKNQAGFQSGPNVTKGLVPQGGACANQFDPAPPAPNDTVAMPRDACFASDSCQDQRFGDSSTTSVTWDLNGYWTTNHGAPPPSNFQTRFETYAYENSTGQIADKSSGGGENGNPQCNPPAAGGPADTVERRTVTAAVINCIANDVKGNASNVEVLKYIKLFITEPAGQPDPNDLWVEVIDEVDAWSASNVFVHDFVQLYR